MAKNVLVLKHFESPKEAGVYHRLVCLTGDRKGEAYVLTGSRVVIGRSDKADIRITDTKASREHAEVTKVGENWVVTDLGSQNGIVVNDKKVTQKQLTESDKLIIGQTVFKFAKVEVGGKPKQVKEVAAVEETPKKSPIFVILIAAGVLGLIFLGSEGDKTEGKKQQSDVKTASPLQDTNAELTQLAQKREKESKELKAKLNVIYQRGLREYREGNYYRAIHEFNLALIMMPGDSQAEFYLRKTKEELDKQIEEAVASAQREEEALKLQSAIKYYCSIIRLLYTVPQDKRYSNAVDKIHGLEAQLGLEKDETDCLKKQQPSQ